LNMAIEDRIRSMYPNATNVNVTSNNYDMQSIRRAYAKVKNSNMNLADLDGMLNPIRNRINNVNQY